MADPNGNPGDPNEVVASKIRKLEKDLAALQLEVADLRANLLGPTSPFNLVLREVGDIKTEITELRTDVNQIKATLADHGTRLDGIDAKLTAHGSLLVRIAAKLGVDNDQ